MNYLNKSLLAAALAIGCTAGAHADTFYVPADAGNAPGITTLTWSFADMANAGVSHLAGTAFDDYFIFNVPDAESISFEVDAVAKGVDFTKSGGGYAVFGLASGNTIDIGGGSKHVLTGGSYDLTSGVYVLEVAGQYSKYNGYYAGQITGIAAAVPEPSTVLMLLAGLAGVAGVARRRNKQA